jgi:hypothetical protein
MLLLLREAQDEVAHVICLRPYFPTLIASGLLLIKSRTSPSYVTLFFQGVQVILPIQLGLPFFIHTYSRCVMNKIAGANSFCPIHHKKWCIARGSIGSGAQAPQYGVKLLNPVAVGFF